MTSRPPGGADGDHPHLRQRHGVCEDRPGQGPAPGRGHRRLGDHRHGPGGHRHRVGYPGRRGAEDLRRPPGPERPGHGAHQPRPAGRAGAPGRDDGEPGPHARPLLRLLGGGRQDHGPQQVRPPAAGRPARHGQDLLRPEHRPERGPFLPEDRGGLLPGDVRRAAGDPHPLRRGAGGELPAPHRQPPGDGLAEDRRRRVGPEPAGHPGGRQSHAQRGGHERQVPPPG